ncbi:MAG: hypothetical protein Q9226_009225 [Calogaya cf. arnoldii]
MAALGTMMMRYNTTGEGPNYKGCWARSTVWGYNQYLKIIEKQYEAVTESVGNAVKLICTENGIQRFEAQFWKEFEERFRKDALDEIHADDTKGQNEKQ